MSIHGTCLVRTLLLFSGLEMGQWKTCAPHMHAWIDRCMLDQYMHISNKEFPRTAPWLTLASFGRRQPLRSARSTLKLGKMGLCSPCQLLLSRFFVKIMIRPNLSKKMPFPRKCTLPPRPFLLMSFGSLGLCGFDSSMPHCSICRVARIQLGRLLF